MSIDVFIFRRDFRVFDNLAWNEMCKDPKVNVLPIFIFNPSQINKQRNKYFSNNAVRFMIESLIDLHDNHVNIAFFEGNDIDVLDKIHISTPINCVHFNGDYTPFARKRDEAIREWCLKNKIDCRINFEDYALVDPSTMKKPYQVFTPFYKKYLKEQVKVPTIPTSKPKFYDFGSIRGRISKNKILTYYSNDSNQVYVKGGRSNGLNAIKKITFGVFKNYARSREYPENEDGTTKLSAYLKYGCVSIREVYDAIKTKHSKSHPLIRELYWRAFYDQVVFHFPRVLEGQVSKTDSNKSLRQKYDKIKWDDDSKHLEAWKRGMTGFPIVDAGMRQLIATGYMHNRVRMIVASFLIKDLRVDWRMGERYFANMLVDYYPSANNGGWLWASGGGADAQQYNRIFNPWLQSMKYDPNCAYIKRWVPELKNVPNKIIHEWYKYTDPSIKYPSPIIDHAKESVKTKERYRKALYGGLRPRDVA